jgi:hypothetical protein
MLAVWEVVVLAWRQQRRLVFMVWISSGFREASRFGFWIAFAISLYNAQHMHLPVFARSIAGITDARQAPIDTRFFPAGEGS